jgi:hypothetical protein
VRLPDRRIKRSTDGSLGSSTLRFLDIFFLNTLVAGAPFAAGAYPGLIEGVGQLGEPQNLEKYPTYIYSAPLGGNGDAWRMIGTVVYSVDQRY